MPNDYTKLDAAILERICSPQRPKARHGGYVPAFFSSIASDAAVMAFASQFQGADWRVVDRRLQALCKTGKIRYDHKAGWMEAV
jgi:hypothetical protein